jgi:hypothetical protein
MLLVNHGCKNVLLVLIENSLTVRFSPLVLCVKKNGDVARGQVHGLRMSLWYEHLGELQEEFNDPGSLKCIRTVNKRAGEFWKIYTSDNLEDNLHGHLLS